MRNLQDHIKEVKEGNRTFENVFQAMSRMILEDNEIEKVNVNGTKIMDYKLFRKGNKHIIGMYEEINSLVSFIKDAAEGGSSKEMAFVLIGEPGNGKTFLVDFLCNAYLNFLSKPGNEKYSFKFTNLDVLGRYGETTEIPSQTFEDPMILAMNLYRKPDDNKGYLESFGFSSEEIDQMFENYRTLGACTQYTLNDLKEYYDDDIQKILDEHVKVVPVPLEGNEGGALISKFSAKDRYTSSSADLTGEESLDRLLDFRKTNHPYKYDLRRGVLARVGGGGIHFTDEVFRNKKDLVQVYLGVIQNQNIEIDGYTWPIDTFVIGTSNNDKFNEFASDPEEAPILDRCRICYVSHNTNFKLQKDLARYALGQTKKKTVSGEDLHIDPNLIYTASIASVLTRLPDPRNISQKLDRIEMLKLAAGEVAGEKSIKTLTEVINELNRSTDVTKRFGQKGLSQRSLGRALQLQRESSATNDGCCMFAKDIFDHFEKVILDNVYDDSDRNKFLEDLKVAKTLYRERIREQMFNAYMDDPQGIVKEVLNYINMIIGMDDQNIGPDNTRWYRDPQTGEPKTIKIDDKFVNAVEERLNLKTDSQKQSFRTKMAKLYSQKVTSNPEYDFMDNRELVKAVTEVRLNSDIGAAGSLVGALSNRQNETNEKLYNRILNTMIKELDYCKTCAEKTIEQFCTPEDQS